MMDDRLGKETRANGKEKGERSDGDNEGSRGDATTSIVVHLSVCYLKEMKTLCT
jgi:hypothetical protein